MGREGRGGAGWRGGTGGGAARGGQLRAGAVGSRQINMESIFHEKVSVGVRWGAVRGSAAGVGSSVAASGAQGGARAPPSQPGWVRGASCLLPMALLGKPPTCAPGALAPEDRAGNLRSIGISGTSPRGLALAFLFHLPRLFGFLLSSLLESSLASHLFTPGGPFPTPPPPPPYPLAESTFLFNSVL